MSTNYHFTLEGLDLYQVTSLVPIFAEHEQVLTATSNANIDVPALDLNQVFFLATDSFDLTDSSDTDLSFAVYPTNWPQIAYSNSIVENNAAEGSTNGVTKVSDDLIRHYAKDIFGIAAADLFSNEEALVSNVESKDSVLRSTIQVSGMKNAGTFQLPKTYDVSLNEASGKVSVTDKGNLVASLVGQLLGAGPDGRARFNGGTDSDIFDDTNRFSATLDVPSLDISGDWYAFKFLPGDTLKLKITYLPPTTNYNFPSVSNDGVSQMVTGSYTAADLADAGAVINNPTSDSVDSGISAAVVSDQQINSSGNNTHLKPHDYTITLNLV